MARVKRVIMNDFLRAHVVQIIIILLSESVFEILFENIDSNDDNIRVIQG